MAKRLHNKTAFIKAHPTLTAAELVKLGKKQGLTFSDKYVYNIRAKGRAGGGGKKSKRAQKVLRAAEHVRQAGGLPGVPRAAVAELILLVDGVEQLALRMPATLAGPLIYKNLVAAAGLSAQQR